MAAVASEIVGADIDVAEERAGGRVVGPDLLFVHECRLAGGTGDDDRLLPVVLVGDDGRAGIIEARDAHAHEAVEHRIGEGELHGCAEGSDQVGVVGALAVAPGELAVGARDRTEGDRGIAERDQLILEVPGQGMDRAWPTLAHGGRRAAGIGPAGVGRLCPAMPVVKREVIAGEADAGSAIQAGAPIDG